MFVFPKTPLLAAIKQLIFLAEKDGGRVGYWTINYTCTQSFINIIYYSFMFPKHYQFVVI